MIIVLCLDVIMIAFFPRNIQWSSLCQKSAGKYWLSAPWPSDNTPFKFDMAAVSVKRSIFPMNWAALHLCKISFVIWAIKWLLLPKRNWVCFWVKSTHKAQNKGVLVKLVIPITVTICKPLFQEKGYNKVFHNGRSFQFIDFIAVNGWIECIPNHWSLKSFFQNQLHELWKCCWDRDDDDDDDDDDTFIKLSKLCITTKWGH